MQSELKRTHGCGVLCRDHQGLGVVLNGWVDTIRDHGGVLFANLRDRSGTVQIVFPDPGVLNGSDAIRPEYVVAVTGTVALRPSDAVNPHLPTGEVEVRIQKLTVLNPADVLPFEVSARSREQPGEDVRLRYRYLDLRRARMQRNLRTRHRVAQLCREFLDRRGFLEIETPFLTRSTPEGARDFLVPCRLARGQFYALPQSPQLFKQLLMVSGFELYFQVVRCFRDEDLRADRQPEFTQIDVEMSFVDESDVRGLIDALFALVFKETLGLDVPVPVPVLKYADAMAAYGTDRPDLRFGAPLRDITSLAASSDLPFLRQAAETGGVVALAVPEGGRLARAQLDARVETARTSGASGALWFRRKANALSGPGAKAFRGALEGPVIEALSLDEGDLGFVAAAARLRTAQEICGQSRLALAAELDLIPRDRFAFTWVTEFPLLEWDAETHRWVSVHHPFTSPVAEDLPLLDSSPGRVRARAYDIVVNGVELGGGSIRIHRRDLQEKVFRAIGIGPEEAVQKFGFLLEGLRYGAPPHGGIALGLDRMIAMLTGEASIRDVIAFPKTQKGGCVLTGAPSEVADDQLAELGIRLAPPPAPTSA